MGLLEKLIELLDKHGKFVAFVFLAVIVSGAVGGWLYIASLTNTIATLQTNNAAQEKLLKGELEVYQAAAKARTDRLIESHKMLAGKVDGLVAAAKALQDDMEPALKRISVLTTQPATRAANREELDRTIFDLNRRFERFRSEVEDVLRLFSSVKVEIVGSGEARPVSYSLGRGTSLSSVAFALAVIVAFIVVLFLVLSFIWNLLSRAVAKEPAGRPTSPLDVATAPVHEEQGDKPASPSEAEKK